MESFSLCMGAMVPKALRHDPHKMIAPTSHAHIRSTSKPPCNFAALSTIRRVWIRNLPFVACAVANRQPICVQSHGTLLKQKEQCFSDSFQRSLFSELWIEDCIPEIVKHIHEAPFLQMLFNGRDDCCKVITQRQRFPSGGCLSADENWMEMKSHVIEALPDAIILVHDLSCSDIQDGNGEKGLAKQRTDEKRSKGMNLWGILVLGKTITKSACYILETTTTASSFGTCTHFCLTKAQSFGPSWVEQIQSSWLLNRDIQVSSPSSSPSPAPPVSSLGRIVTV